MFHNRFIAILSFIGFAGLFSAFFWTAHAQGKGAGTLSVMLTSTPLVTQVPTSIPFNWQNDHKNQNDDPNLAESSAPVRGILDDQWADVIIGQPGFDQITPNEVVGNKLFNPGGIYVDRSVQPNRVYIYDAGNNRVLGFRYLGVAQGGPEAGQPCTSNSDHPGSTCVIDPTRNADIVLGQPSFNSSACNGDSARQNYPAIQSPSNTTLCGLNGTSISILEGGSMAAMATDSQGNFYLPDFFNNRILRYNNPFDTDSVADYVWGQSGFASSSCNMGSFYSSPNNRSLCLAPPPGHGNIKTGVAVDSQGNLWVADTQNNRVLRFPFDPASGAPAKTANLVLGQANFNTATFGLALNQMASPTSVRVDNNGNVYVADGEHFWTHTVGRILIFHPPLSNGMPASQMIQAGLGEPTAVELDPTDGFWVNDSDNQRVLHFDFNGTLQQTVSDVPSRTWGGLGIDRDSNLMITGWDPQEVFVYTPPSYEWTSTFLRADEYGSFNQEGSRGFVDPLGLEVAAGQMIVADGPRLVFWNNVGALTNNYPPADGVIGQPDFQTRPRWAPGFGRMRADDHGRLWVLQGDGDTAQILAYQLPLITQATPILTINSPLPLQGGGTFTWSASLNIGGIAYQPGCDCLWLSDRDENRTFRIRNVSANPTVDIVLGQTNSAGVHCNQGRDSDDDYVHPRNPLRNSLCAPGAITIDPAGNLYVADHTLEIAGNGRLLEFDANILPNAPTSVVYAIPASRVFGRDGSFTKADCTSGDPMCGPWEPAFDNNNRMIIGFNGYLGPRFPVVYEDALTNPVPIKSLADFVSHPFSIRSVCGDLFMLDLTRNRILIYKGTPPANIIDPCDSFTYAFKSVGAYDGWILESSETSSKGGAINNGANTFNLGDNVAKMQYRGLLSFSTGASLPDNAVITSVTLKMKKSAIIGGGNPLTTFQGFMVDIKKGPFGAGALETGDFQAAVSVSYGPFNTPLVGGWYSINLTGAKSYINKLAAGSGLTQIRLRFKLDDNNNAVANYLSLYSGNAPLANRPQLIIQYYVMP